MKIKALYYGKTVYIIGFYTGKDGQPYVLYYSKDARYKSHEINTDIYFRFLIVEGNDRNE